MISIEVAAKTVQKAIETGLEQLGKSMDEVDIKVLSEGGFLRKARVELTIVEAEKPARNEGYSYKRTVADDSDRADKSDKNNNLDKQDKSKHNNNNKNDNHKSHDKTRFNDDRAKSNEDKAKFNDDRAKSNEDKAKSNDDRAKSNENKAKSNKEDNFAKPYNKEQHSSQKPFNKERENNHSKPLSKDSNQSATKEDGHKPFRKEDKQLPERKAFNREEQSPERKAFNREDNKGDNQHKPFSKEGRSPQHNRERSQENNHERGQDRDSEFNEAKAQKEERHERPRTPITDEIAEAAVDFVSNLLNKMDIEFSLTQSQKEGELTISIECGSGVLIGFRGETLDAIEYVTSLAINKSDDKYYRINVDCNDYRTKRTETLTSLAKRMAEKAVKTGRKVIMEPMSSSNRKIIHSVLSENDRIVTRSEGRDPTRRIVIIPKRFK